MDRNFLFNHAEIMTEHKGENSYAKYASLVYVAMASTLVMVKDREDFPEKSEWEKIFGEISAEWVVIVPTYTNADQYEYFLESYQYMASNALFMGEIPECPTMEEIFQKFIEFMVDEN